LTIERETELSHTAEATMRANVTVTFLRMERPPTSPAPAFPEGVEVQTLASCPVPHYRRLYNTVGGPYLWWLRRIMPDQELASLLSRQAVSIHVVSMNGVEAGFYELDASYWPAVNLSYFGLMPHAIGAGIGNAFLRHAVDAAFAMGARALTVNTCTADHPRALPAYLRVGFRVVRAVSEVWDIPLSLGLEMPPHLRR
jgi:GNAT superfamily N-acetyltransferase